MYIKVDFVKKLLDVDIIFDIENAIVDDMYFVFLFLERDLGIHTIHSIGSLQYTCHLD